MFVSVCNSMQIDAHEKERLSDRDSEKNAGVLTEHLTDTIATMNDALHANEVWVTSIPLQQRQTIISIMIDIKEE